MPLTLLFAVAMAGLSGSGFVIWRFQDAAEAPASVPTSADMMPLSFAPQQNRLEIPLATLSGVTQLPQPVQERLESELSTIDTLADGLRYVRRVHAAYREANVPRPAVSLRLPAPGRPHLAVEVSESDMTLSRGHSLLYYTQSATDKRQQQARQARMRQWRTQQQTTPTETTPAPQQTEAASPTPAPQPQKADKPKKAEKAEKTDKTDASTPAPQPSPPTPQAPSKTLSAPQVADSAQPPAEASPSEPATTPTQQKSPAPPASTPAQPPVAPEDNFYEMEDKEAPSADFFTTDEIPQDQQLWLELIVDDRRRLDVFTAMQLPGGKILLPLQELIEAIGFPIEVNPATGTAEGWFVREERTFYLDAGTQDVRVKGESFPWPADLRIFSSDIYVPLADFEAWFPLKFKLALNQLALYAESTMTLPEKARMQRRQTWEERARKKKKQRATQGPQTVLPYQQFAFPHIQINQQANASIDGQTQQTTWSQSTGFQAEGDILGFGGHLTGQVAQSNDESIHLDRASLRLTRQSAEGNLLGPAEATRLELGDIDLPNLALAGGGGVGRGLYVTNTPTGYVSDINTFELTGEATVGWDIEVYQSGYLKAFGVVPDDGRFRFTNLTLQPGLNIFRILLFGPEGQREERVQRFYLGPNMVNEGQFYYEVGATESNLGVIPTEDIEKRSGEAVFSGTYGLNRYMSLRGGVMSGRLHEENDTVGTAGMQFGYKQMFGQLTLAQSMAFGQAWDARLQTQFGPTTSVGGQWTSYSEDWAAEENIKHRISVDARRTFHILTPVDIDVDYTREIDPAERTQHTLETTQGLRLGDVSLENSLEHEWTEESATTTGTFQFTTQRWQFPLRGSVRYQPNAEEDWLKTANLSGQFQLASETNLNMQLNHDFTGDNITRINGNLNMPVGKTTLQLNGGVDTQGTASVGLGMSFHFVPAVNTSSTWLPAYSVQPRNKGFGFGSVKVRTFIDANGNEQYDDGEIMVPDVIIRNSRNGRDVKTLETGTGMLYGLSPFIPNTLTVEKEELPDIYLRPVVEKKNIVPHRGFSGTIDFPLQQMGEIAGMVVSQQADKLHAQANIPLRLYNAAGEEVDDIFSAYDGFFLFPAIPTGTYEIRLPDKAAEVLGFKLTKPVKVTLTPENPIPEEINIILQQVSTTGASQSSDTSQTSGTTTVY